MSIDLDDDEDPLDWEERSDAVPFWRHAFAGSFAGITEHVGMFPLDTVKTRMQVSSHPGSPGVVGTMRTVLEERGFGGLWRGASVIGAGCVPAHCGLFMTYELGKQKLLQSNSSHQPVMTAACGMAASTVHDVILTPTDVVKQRLQLGCYKGGLHCLRSIIAKEGMGTLFRSLPVTMMINGPNTAVLTAVNESMKLHLGIDRTSGVGLHWYFLCAGVGGAVASITTLPLDNLKTRIQTQGVTRLSDGQTRAPSRQGAAAIFRGIIKNEGFRGFYRGLVPRMMIATPAGAMCWGTYEAMQALLCKLYDDHPTSGSSEDVTMRSGQSGAWNALGKAHAATQRAITAIVSGKIVTMLHIDRPRFLLQRLSLMDSGR
jgi:solute carrier family 25 iron transporter 28/37